MRGNYSRILLLVLILLVSVPFVLGATPLTTNILNANAQGNIYCFDENNNPWILTYDDPSSANKFCRVAEKTFNTNILQDPWDYQQVVLISQQKNSAITTHYEPVQVTYHVKELNFTRGASLHFANTAADRILNSQSTASFSVGGDGGLGKVDGNTKGGNGGNGGNGAPAFMFGQKGSNGFDGTNNGNVKAAKGQAQATGYPGANVRILAEKISFYPKAPNSPDVFDIFPSISVAAQKSGNGKPGSDDNDGLMGTRAGGGGAGGEGGHGAGRIIVQAIEIVGEGIIDARGGIGGNGGTGGDAIGTTPDGGGGGAGGPGEAGEIIVYASTIPWATTNYFILNQGAPGQIGIGGYSDGGDGGNGVGISLQQSTQVFSSYIAQIYTKETDNDPAAIFSSTTISYLQCIDGIDNDGDGDYDWADIDCWPVNRQDVYDDLVEAQNAPFDSLDVNGPLDRGDFIAIPPVLPSWFNGTAIGGEDAVCGDDPGLACAFDYDCVNNFDPDYCVSSSTYLSCSGTIDSCSNYQIPTGGCNAQAPSYCIDDGQGVPGLCRYVPPIDMVLYTSVIPLLEKNCIDLTENECMQVQQVGISCTPQYSAPTINPKQSAIDACEAATISQCMSEPCAIISIPNSDAGFVDPTFKQYFCSPDKVQIQNFEKIDFPLKDYAWWNARVSGAAFKIHHLENNDYISNGDQWFMCGADGLTITNALVVPERGSFTGLSGVDSGISCPSFFAIIGPLVWTGTPGDSCTYGTQPAIAPDWNLYGETILVNSYSDITSHPDDGFFCKRDPLTNQAPGLTFINSMDYTQSACLSDCYYKEGNLVLPIANVLPPEAYGTECPSSFSQAYCSINPFDPTCGNQDLTTPSDNTLLLQDDCLNDLANCLDQTPFDYDDLCNDIRQTDYTTNKKYRGYMCDNPNTYCTTGEYYNSQDHNPPSNICCKIPAEPNPDDYCQPIPNQPITANFCSFLNGQYLSLSSIQNINDYSCVPSGYVISDSDGACCIGGAWQEKFNSSMYLSFTEPGAFTCYQQNEFNRFAECCGDLGTCNNALQNTLFEGSLNEKQYGYYGKGGVLHTLQNFDSYETDVNNPNSGTVVDYVKKVYFANTKRPEFDFVDGGKQLSLVNWNSYDYLEFDIAFNLPGKIQNISIIDSKNQVCTFNNFNNYLITGNATFRWQHVVVPLKYEAPLGGPSLDPCQGFDFTNVEKLRFESSYSGTDLIILVDDFYLSEDSSNRQNTENLFCSGNFRTWVTNLDGPSDIGYINTAVMDLSEYGPHKYACEAQNSFGWTGRVCCGDDTTRKYSQDNFATNNVRGEYYTDEFAGCFGGNVVQNNMRVGSDALNDPTHDGLLYFNKEFIACASSAIKYQNHIYYYNETPFPQSAPLVSKVAQPFEVVGKYVCDASGAWLTLDEVPVSRIIASKMFNLTFDKNGVPYTEYEIRCDTIDEYYSTVSLPQTLGLNSNDITDFCTLRYRDTTTKNQDNVLIGLGLGNQEVSQVLQSLTSHAQQLKLIETTENLTNVCDGIVAGNTNNTAFFQTCTNNYPFTAGASGLRFAYNADFNILFMSVVHNEVKQYDSLFETNRIQAYLHSYWLSFLNFFGNIFGANPGDEYNDPINWSGETLLPFIAQNEVDFSTVYMSKAGNKHIKAFVHYDLQDDYDYYTIEYTNFATDVRPLVSEYFSTNPVALNYLRGPNKQIIQLVNPNIKGYSKDPALSAPVPKTFAPSFDWKRLAPMYIIDTTSYGQTITAAPNNGIVDVNEFCDTDTQGNTYFKFNSNKCQLWNATNLQGTVSCVMPGNTLDHSGCTYNASIKGPAGFFN